MKSLLQTHFHGEIFVQYEKTAAVFIKISKTKTLLQETRGDWFGDICEKYNWNWKIKTIIIGQRNQLNCNFYA